MDDSVNKLSFLYKIFNHLKAKKVSVFYIFIFIVVFFLVKGLIYLKFRKEQIIKDWPNYKCKPYILPIAGAFREDGFLIGTKNNFNECININAKVSFSVLIRPIQYIFEILTKSIRNVVNTVDKLRNLVSIMRELFQKMIGQTFEQISRSVSTVQFYTEKFRNLMKKQFAMFQLIFYYLETMRATFDSFINGPLPITLLFLSIFGILLIFVLSMCAMCPIFPLSFFACPICALCFTPYSLIKMDDGSHKPISDIKIGDIIYPSQRVLGRMEFHLDQPQLVYGLDKAFASGSHLYYHPQTSQPIRVIDHAEYTDIATTTELISLATENMTIYSGNDVFGDYYEASNPELDTLWNYKVISSLNPGIYQFMTPFKNYASGFVHEQQVSNGTGEIVSIITDDVKLFDYMGVICSGNNIVWEYNQWKRVENAINAKTYINNKYDKLYHYTTRLGTIEINNLYFRDFLETNDKSTYDWWNENSPKYIRYSCV